MKKITRIMMMACGMSIAVKYLNGKRDLSCK